MSRVSTTIWALENGTAGRDVPTALLADRAEGVCIPAIAAAIARIRAAAGPVAGDWFRVCSAPQPNSDRFDDRRLPWQFDCDAQ